MLIDITDSADCIIIIYRGRGKVHNSIKHSQQVCIFFSGCFQMSIRSSLCIISILCCCLCAPAMVLASGEGGNCLEGQVTGCDGVCDSGAVDDLCGVCGGDNSSCADCKGIPNGPTTYDECGVCDGPGAGPCGCDYTVVKDDCGVCGGDGTSCLIGPCENADINAVNFTSQKHDGVWTKFNGSQSSFDASNNLHFQYIRDRTVVGCIPNPNTAGLVQTLQNGGTLDLFTDYRWQGRSANRDKVSQQRQDQLTSRLQQLAQENSTSCFICGHVRKKKGCFPPEALLTLISGESITAAEVSAGDVLLNPISGEGVRVLQVIEGPEELPLVGIAFEGGYLRVSQDHPVLTDTGLKAARDVTSDDKIFDKDRKAQQVTRVSLLPVDEGQRVINFILSVNSKDDADHMLVADGVIAGDLILQWILQDRNE